MEGKQLSFLTEQVCAKPRKGSMLGKHHSLATKRKMSLSAKNCSKYTTEQRKANAVKMRQRITSASIQKMSRSLTGKPMDMITRQKISSTLKGLITGEQHPMFGKHHTEKAKEKISKASTIHWKDPQIREKQLRAIVEASFIRPTSAEVKLNDILNEVCPNEYLYNGDGGIIIDRCIPDFTNVNGQKKVIEMFGDYWHSQHITGKLETDEEKDKISKYAKFGYKCLIIWERELEDKEAVAIKVKEFNAIGTP